MIKVTRVGDKTRDFAKAPQVGRMSFPAVPRLWSFMLKVLKYVSASVPPDTLLVRALPLLPGVPSVPESWFGSSASATLSKVLARVANFMQCPAAALPSHACRIGACTVMKELGIPIPVMNTHVS